MEFTILTNHGFYLMLAMNHSWAIRVLYTYEAPDLVFKSIRSAGRQNLIATAVVTATVAKSLRKANVVANS